MKYRRKHSRRHVKCVMCTPNRFGNSQRNGAKNHHDRKELAREKASRRDATD